MSLPQRRGMRLIGSGHVRDTSTNKEYGADRRFLGVRSRGRSSIASGFLRIPRLYALLRLADAPAWSAPAIVGLGLLSAMLEGIGLSLFIPLVELLGAQEEGASVLRQRLTHFLRRCQSNGAFRR